MLYTYRDRGEQLSSLDSLGRLAVVLMLDGAQLICSFADGDGLQEDSLGGGVDQTLQSNTR